MTLELLAALALFAPADRHPLEPVYPTGGTPTFFPDAPYPVGVNDPAPAGAMIPIVTRYVKTSSRAVAS